MTIEAGSWRSRPRPDVSLAARPRTSLRRRPVRPSWKQDFSIGLSLRCAGGCVPVIHEGSRPSSRTRTSARECVSTSQAAQGGASGSGRRSGSRRRSSRRGPTGVRPCDTKEPPVPDRCGAGGSGPGRRRGSAGAPSDEITQRDLARTFQAGLPGLHGHPVGVREPQHKTRNNYRLETCISVSSGDGHFSWRDRSGPGQGRGQAVWLHRCPVANPPRTGLAFWSWARIRATSPRSAPTVPASAKSRWSAESSSVSITNVGPISSGAGEFGDKTMTPSSRSRGIRNRRTTSLISTTTPWARDRSPSRPPATAPRLGVGRRRGPTVALPQTCGTVLRAVLQPRGQRCRHPSDGVVAFATGPATQDVAHAKDGDSAQSHPAAERLRSAETAALASVIPIAVATAASPDLTWGWPTAPATGSLRRSQVLFFLKNMCSSLAVALLGQRSACASCALVMLERPSTP